MHLILISWVIMLLSGVPSLFYIRSNRIASYIAVIGMVAGCVVAMVPVFASLAGNQPAILIHTWNVPWGSFVISLDGLSGFFCLLILVLAPASALYGFGYLAHDRNGSGPVWFFYNLLTISMMALVVAGNGLLFLYAWEIMALSSFFLVVYDHEHAQVREAGWIYLVATHLGTVALLVFFALLGNSAGSLDFDKIAAVSFSPSLAGPLFILAMIGFGSKAGYMPMHVWLPEAHPAAPSHVSALMSGVMIKMGIYGLLRALILLGNPPEYWGWTLVVTGLVTGILGVVFALAQHDIKRLLAYSSVENIGIITIGIGTGLLGMSWHDPALVILGFGGGMLHVMNHALFKGLLFMGAGAVFHGTGTREMDRLGGLMKRMPWTGITFFASATAISGLPPFNGFISEFLIYSAGFTGATSGSPKAVLLAAGILPGLAVIGGLAAACFAKCFGIVFLGNPRGAEASDAREVSAVMRWPMGVLAASCLLIGLAGPFSMRVVFPAVRTMAGTSEMTMAGSIQTAAGMLGYVAVVFIILLVLTALLLLIRRALPRGRENRMQGTWDCGYAYPTARMQYSASSFAQPLTDLFNVCLGTRMSVKKPHGYFPDGASFSTSTPDMAQHKLFAPIFRTIDRCLAPVRKIQHGGIHLYILYIVLTLIILLIWKVGFPG